MSKHIVIGHNGDPCPRCGVPTEIRRHAEITARELRRPFYYARWFYCDNPRCIVTTVMPERHKVFNRRPPETKRAAPLREDADEIIGAGFVPPDPNDDTVPF